MFYKLCFSVHYLRYSCTKSCNPKVHFHNISHINNNPLFTYTLTYRQLIYTLLDKKKNFYSIRYINIISSEARKLNPKNKTMIAPYGTRITAPDDKYVKQLEQMDLDIIAYQDEVGVQKTTVSQEAAYYEALYKAHRKAGRAEIWADMELFEFEGTVYHSALLPAPWERVKAQLEEISPFVDKIITYAYQGMMTKPGGIARCGYPEGAEQLYTDYKGWLDSSV